MSTFRNREKHPRRAEGGRDEDQPSREVGRRERARREKLSRISQAAWELFHRRGFGRATTREIAEAADVGVGRNLVKNFATYRRSQVRQKRMMSPAAKQRNRNALSA